MLARWLSAEPLPPLVESPISQFAKVRALRPKDQKLTIGVIGSYRRFQASVMFKIGNFTGHYHSLPFDDLEDKVIADPNTVLILWSPRGDVRVTDAQRKRIPRRKQVMNDVQFDCNDKKQVQAAFERVSQRSLSVDPLKYAGAAVVKSRRNGRHDGSVISLPVVSPMEGCTYERLIDNTVGDDFVFDIRVPFIKGEIPLAYIKLRQREIRFENVSYEVSLNMPSDVLSADELGLCKRFFLETGLEYGEIDVLRDRTDRHIYIVDANNTPAGPPKGLALSERNLALRIMARTVCRNFFGRDC